LLCEPKEPNGIALVLSNGVDRLCYQTTKTAFINAMAVKPQGGITPIKNLADTGFNFEFWLFIAGLLSAAGAMMLLVSRSSKKN
jgi:hypothetical protein